MNKNSLRMILHLGQGVSRSNTNTRIYLKILKFFMQEITRSSSLNIVNRMFLNNRKLFARDSIAYTRSRECLLRITLCDAEL